MDRLAFLLYKTVAFLLGLLPPSLCSRLGSLLGILGHAASPKYRRLVRHNLAIAFPSMPERDRHRLARKSFAHLGANLFSSTRVALLPPEKVRACVTLEGYEHVEALLSEKRGYIPILCHLGNWELLAQIWPLIFPGPSGTLYQRLSNPHMDADVRRHRARLGLQLFERKEGFQGAMQLLRQGGAAGVLADQHAGDAGLWCPLFGRLASTTPLPAIMALRTGAALLPVAVYTAAHGRWIVRISPPIAPVATDPAIVTAQVNQALESMIRHQPADWFWVHNRWKTPRPRFLLSDYKRGVVLPDPSMLPPSCPPQPFRLLVRATNWLGDAVMSLPAVRAMKHGRPDLHLAILTPAKLADFWRAVAEVDEVICIEARDSVFGVARKIRGRFDAAVLFPNSLRSALEVFLAGIHRRVGYAGHRRRYLLNQIYSPATKTPAAKPKHQVHHYLALARHIGADIEAATAAAGASVTPAATATVTAAAPASTSPTSSAAPQKRKPVLGLCPGAEYGPAKRWMPERFGDVLQQTQHGLGAHWKVFGVAKDRPIAQHILEQADTGEDLVGRTTLAELIDHLRSCDLLVTNDTGTMHLAAALGVPVVAIFGSTEPELTGPLGSPHRVLRKHVECSPCFLRTCPIDFRCMHAVTVPMVLAAIDELLALPSDRSRALLPPPVLHPTSTASQPADPIPPAHTV